MTATTAALPTLDLLRRHVLETLCAHDQFDPEHTPMYQGVVSRNGKPCGLFFQVQGPRRVRACAVWVGDEDRVLFYDSNGRRFAETTLSEAPDPRDLGEKRRVESCQDEGAAGRC
jgi:hypothetical protein